MEHPREMSLAERFERQMPSPRWTPAMFQAACNAGCFEDMRVELIGGRIVELTDDPPHLNCAYNTEASLRRIPPETEWFVVRNVFVHLHGWTPLPDVGIHRGALEPTYVNRLPAVGDTALIVEVSDTTYLKDRRVKLPRYALAGIPYCWIINLERSRVEVYSQPEGRRYRTRQEYGEADEVPVIIDGTHSGTIPVREILPKKREGQ
jgi:hypothetical protein